MKEKRIHERIPISASVYCRTYIDLHGEQQTYEVPVKLDILNLSVGGILVRSETFIEIDRVLHYTFYLEEVPYIIMSRVKWSAEIIGGYVYGLEFLMIPNMMHRHLHEFVKRQIQYTRC